MIIVSLDISISNYLEDLLQGEHHLVQADCHLHAPVGGLGGAVGIYLDIGSTVLTDFLDFLSTFTNNSSNNS